MQGRSLEHLIGLLRADGLLPDMTSVADALWLAQRLGPPPAATPGADRQAEDSSRRPVAPPLPPYGPADRAGPEPEPRLSVPHPMQQVAPPRHVPPYAVPEPGSLPGLLHLHRALRPLQRYRGGTPDRYELDEERTAGLSARTGITVPVLSPATRRTASLQLLFDSSSSMVVWEQVAEQMRQVMAQTGAFRDVRLHWLHEAEDGSPVVAVGRAGDRPRPAHNLVDPTGRTFTLMITDGAGPLWRSGAVQRLLHRLAVQAAPVAILQPLPQRLWPRTALSPRPGYLSLAGRDGGRCWFDPDEPRYVPDALPVPVLPVSRDALGRWAKWVTGSGPGRIRGAAAWVRPDHPTAPHGGRRLLTARDRVSRFRADASPTAQRLAAYLAAAPLLLPVMLGVQRTMQPSEAGPSELAEVLLGGLLSHANPAGTEGETWYDFAPGVRELLLERLAKDEAVLVLRHCAEYVERHFGADTPNFASLAAAQLSGTDAPSVGRYRPAGPDGEPDRVPAPFAAVPAEVVRRFTPSRPRRTPAPGEHLAEARELLARHAREQDVVALWEAIRRLGGIGAGPPGPQTREANTELAEALLALYEWNPDSALLDQAEQALARCLDPPDATGTAEGRARLLRGRLYRQSARRAEESEGAEAALRRLESASVELDLAARRLTDQDALLMAVLERAAVLRELARLLGDPALLHEAAGSLRAMAGVQTLWAPRSSDLLLQLGRVLLEIATSTTYRARTHAAEAVRELSAARELLSAEPDGPRRMAGLLLDLADAQERAGGARDAVLRTLEDAEHAVDFAPDMCVPVALRIARTYASGADAGPDALRQAGQVLRRAAARTQADPAALARLLEARADLLISLADAGAADGTEVTEAVDVLRSAVRATPANSGPDRGRRLALLGRALRMRFARAGDVTDLHEAEWLLSQAVAVAYPPGAAARAWYERGCVQRELGLSLGRFSHLEYAVDHFRTAGRAARDAADEPFAATADDARAEVTRRLRGPAGQAD